MIYVISDTHFFHKNIITYCRPEFENLKEMHDHLIKEWNSVVEECDTVIHLGDVAFGPKENREAIEKIFSQLNGKKILLPGNHDRYVLSKNRHFYNKPLFDTVEQDNDKIVINKVILSHEPIDIIPEGYINIHGHVHADPSAALFKLDTRRINVCVDAMGSYKPKDITELLERR